MRAALSLRALGRTMSESGEPTAGDATARDDGLIAPSGGRGPRSRRPAAAAAGLVGVVIVALVAGVVLLAPPAASPDASPGNPGAATGPSVSAGSPAAGVESASPVAAGASPGPSAPIASPTPSPIAWGALDLPPLTPVAELTADEADAAGPDPTTTFTLRSTDGTPAVTLAKGLTVEPPVRLVVAEGPDASRANVRPAAPLERGAAYRFTLAAPDGSLAGGWVFDVAAPPRVVGTLPADRTSGVPVDTGIEISFDRDGVADPTRWFSITPKAKGRFEQHDRTWVFVPEALAKSTVYTVRLSAGVPLEGSNLRLEEPLEVRFETTGPEKARPVSIQPATVVAEVATGQPPVVAISVTSYGEARPPKSVKVILYGVPDVAAAVGIASALVDQDSWGEWGESRRDAVDTSRLAVAARLSVPLVLDTRDGYAGALMFQRALHQGWYLLDLPDDIAAGQQVLLQVTPVAAYTVMARDRTLAWVNRVGSGPIAGATVRFATGPIVGVTAADGLMLATTPPAILAAIDAVVEGPVPHPILVIEAPGIGAVVAPVGASRTGVEMYGGSDDSGGWDPSAGRATSQVASTLQTDRNVYRQTDSIAAWGMVRDPATGESPRSVTLEVAPVGAESWGWEEEEEAEAPPRTTVAAATVATSPLGVFTATLGADDLPLGTYEVTLYVNDRRLDSRWIEVGTVRKPAYRLVVAVDHAAVMAGDPVVVTATASFYDGTPVRGLPLTLGAPGVEDVPVTTGPDGRASTMTHPTHSGDASVSIAGAELGEVGSATVGVEVFPSAYSITLDTAEIVGEAVRIAGTVRTVDLARVEAGIAAGESWREDVGPAASAVPVAIAVRSTIWVARRTGTAYDFILKKAVPVYTYDERELPAVEAAARTGADGGFATTVQLPRAARGLHAQVYADAVVTDRIGRPDSASEYAERRETRPKTTLHTVWLDPGPADDPTYGADTCGGSSADGEYAYGQTVRLLLRDAAGPVPAGPSTRFLFVTARDGIRDASVARSAEYRRVVDATEARGFAVLGVAFDGERYRAAPGTFRAYLDPETRTIDVRVASDLAAGATHLPGDPAWVRVSTRDRAGRPVAADVVVVAIDEKLYDANLAWEPGALWYPAIWPDAAIMGRSVSHELPELVEDLGCGRSTTGGGGGPEGGVRDVRSDFRDRVLFARVRTGSDGTVRVPFDLPDDLTAWRVTARAVTDDLRTGSDSVDVPVGLPFFVEPVAADTVLSTDAPGLVLRAYGPALRAGDVVHYVVRAPTLATAPIAVDAGAFTGGVAWLSRVGAAMPLGTHRIEVEGTVRSGSRVLRDAKEMTIVVVAARNGIRTTRIVAVTGDSRPPGGDGALTTCTIADAGRASLVPLLDEIAGGGPRADQAAAAAAARGILASEFASEEWRSTSAAFDPSPYLVDWRGISLLPYASADLQLTALAALGAPDAFPLLNVEPYLLEVASSSDETRDRRIVATAGLAALGSPVAADLRQAAVAADLSVAERVWLAVGLGEAGDLTRAAAIERALLAESGQRSGAWARLRVGSTAHASIEATALLAIVAARIGDPLAPDLESYVREAVDTEAVHPLEEVAYVSRAMERLPRTTARVAYTVQGTRHEATLGPRRSVALVLTPPQRAETVVRTLEGAASLVCSWDAPAAGGDLPHDASISLKRTVEPAGPIPAGSLVTVRLSVSVGALAPSGFYRVVETLPAGLAPTDDWVMRQSADGEDVTSHEESPWVIEGNRVQWGFWWGGTTSGDGAILRVTARVVAPGGYVWEPAVVQLESAPGVGASTEPTGIVVNAP